MRHRLRVKEVMSQKGETMSGLARKAQLTFKTVKDLCRYPHSDPRVTTMLAIAHALGVTLNELIEEIPDEAV